MSYLDTNNTAYDREDNTPELKQCDRCERTYFAHELKHSVMTGEDYCFGKGTSECWNEVKAECEKEDFELNEHFVEFK